MHLPLEDLNPSMRPNLLGIGGAKCGTTWFADQLSLHSDIYLPPQKELGALYYNDIKNRLQEYQDYFIGAEKFKFRCDFSVRYLSEFNAPAAAARYTPDAQIIVILRDPVDQIQSHYWHHVRQNFSQPKPVNPRPNLFEAIEDFPNLLLEPALYGKHLLRWHNYFPPERFLILDYNELRSDLASTLAKVCHFLDLPPFQISSYSKDSQPTRDGRRGVSPRGGILSTIYPFIYSAFTHGPYQSAKRIFGVRHVETVKRRLKLRESMEAIFFKSGYAKLNFQDRLKLRSIFSSDLKILENKIGFSPASSWSIAP